MAEEVKTFKYFKYSEAMGETLAKAAPSEHQLPAVVATGNPTETSGKHIWGSTSLTVGKDDDLIAQVRDSLERISDGIALSLGRNDNTYYNRVRSMLTEDQFVEILELVAARHPRVVAETLNRLIHD